MPYATHHIFGVSSSSVFILQHHRHHYFHLTRPTVRRTALLSKIVHWCQWCVFVCACFLISNSQSLHNGHGRIGIILAYWLWWWRQQRWFVITSIRIIYVFYCHIHTYTRVYIYRWIVHLLLFDHLYIYTIHIVTMRCAFPTPIHRAAFSFASMRIPIIIIIIAWVCVCMKM